MIHFRFALAATVSVCSTLALAGPPPKGWSGSYQNQLISCDTKEQITGLADAMKKSNADFIKAFKELAAKTDDKNEPTCVIGYVTGITVGENEEIGIVNEVHYWAVHVGTEKGDWWVLYGEKDVAPSASKSGGELPTTQ